MTSSVISPAVYDSPLVNPSPAGLYSATLWPADGPPRWIGGGERFRRRNFGGAFGVWPEDWCGVGADTSAGYVAGVAADSDGFYPLPGRPDSDGLYAPSAGGRPDSDGLYALPTGGGGGDTGGGEDDRPRKVGPRPALSDPFYAVTVWASDECDALAASREEVWANAGQILRLNEQQQVERELAGRLLADAQTEPIPSAPDLAAGLALLVQMLADTGTVGVIHAAAGVEVAAEAAKLVIRSGGATRAPGGHAWVFGGGYLAGGLDGILVATSQPVGWRTEPVTRDGITRQGRYYAMAERSVLVGYEFLVGAVRIGA